MSLRPKCKQCGSQLNAECEKNGAQEKPHRCVNEYSKISFWFSEPEI